MATCEGTATKSGLRNPPIKSIFIGLICGADRSMRIYLANKARQLPVEKQVQWHGVLVCENFPEGIMIYEYARIRIVTSAMEISNSWANLVSDGKVTFSRNPR